MKSSQSRRKCVLPPGPRLLHRRCLRREPLDSAACRAGHRLCHSCCHSPPTAGTRGHCLKSPLLLACSILGALDSLDLESHGLALHFDLNIMCANSLSLQSGQQSWGAFKRNFARKLRKKNLKQQKWYGRVSGILIALFKILPTSQAGSLAQESITLVTPAWLPN